MERMVKRQVTYDLKSYEFSLVFHRNLVVRRLLYRSGIDATCKEEGVCSRMEDIKYAEEPLLLLQYLIAYAVFLVDRKPMSKYWLYENDDPVRRKISLCFKVIYFADNGIGLKRLCEWSFTVVKRRLAHMKVTILTNNVVSLFCDRKKTTQAHDNNRNDKWQCIVRKLIFLIVR